MPLSNIDIPAILETERLELRLLTFDMCEDLNAAIIASAEEFKPWFEWIHPKLPTLKDTQEITLTHMKEQINKEAFHFMVYTKDTNTCVARISLDKGEPNIPSFNIGYWTHSHHTGNGFMREALDKLCDFAINILKSKRLKIYYDTENKGSEKLIQELHEKFGFEYIGIMKNNIRRKHDGTLRHHAMYAFTTDD